MGSVDRNEVLYSSSRWKLPQRLTSAEKNERTGTSNISRRRRSMMLVTNFPGAHLEEICGV